MSTSAALEAVLREPTTANYLQAARELRAERDGGLPLLRVAVARSFTVEPLLPYLEVECALAGARIADWIGGCGTYRQEIYDAQSGLYGFRPDIVLLALDRDELVPALLRDFLSRTPGEIELAIDAAVGELRALAQAFHARSSGTLVVHTLPPPAFPAAGFADGRLRPGQREAFERLNRAIQLLADEEPGVAVFDLAAHVAGAGELEWEDPRFALVARAPIAAKHLPGLARAYARTLALLANLRRKCLVVDLDGTLWGGVLGEDGWEGVEVGSEYPGNAYVALQRALLDLRRRGVLLAIASKNDEDDVRRVFERRREMVLGWDDFAARRIGWQDKATGVRDIAAELGLAPSALVFVDNDPAERALIAHLIPDVLVPEWPSEPALYARALREIASLDTLRITQEDRARTAFYEDEARRRAVRSSRHSLRDYYEALAMEASVEPVSSASLARASQLTLRTNQFNLTLRRFTEAELSALAASRHHVSCLLSLRDRFGEAGQVAFAVLALHGEVARVEVFLVSCRVLGRGVEDFLLAQLVEEARSRGAERLVGVYVRAERNAQAADFYERHGFAREPGSADEWALDLGTARLEPPPWIRAAPREAQPA